MYLSGVWSIHFLVGKWNRVSSASNYSNQARVKNSESISKKLQAAAVPKYLVTRSLSNAISTRKYFKWSPPQKGPFFIGKGTYWKSCGLIRMARPWHLLHRFSIMRISFLLVCRWNFQELVYRFSPRWLSAKATMHVTIHTTCKLMISPTRWFTHWDITSTLAVKNYVLPQCDGCMD